MIRHFGQLDEDLRARYQPRSQVTTVDVCVIGGGSGGIGAAMASARDGAQTLLVEATGITGGTSTRAWVSNWEPVDGALGLPAEIYSAMARLPNAVVHCKYSTGGIRQGGDGLPFEPWAFDQVVRQKLAEAGCMMWFHSRFVRAMVTPYGVETVEVQTPWGPKQVRAKVFIDSTADGELCRSAGCEALLGEDPRSLFGEPSAPEVPELQLNAITLCYRIRNVGVCQVPEDLPAPARPSAFMQPCPNGDLVVNCVGMLEGRLICEMPRDRLREEAERRVRGHLAWLQREKGFETWALVGIAPELGIRETYRVLGEYVLTEHDIRQGLAKQQHPDIIAIADHPLDMHGSRSQLHELPGPYGIPFRCLIPKGKRNLLIASRAASFSHIAAASCRLSRTIMMLGFAAGTAAAMGVESGASPADVNTQALRQRLRARGVKLEASTAGHPQGPIRRLAFSVLV